MLRRLIENFILKGTDWIFRATSFEALLLKSACIVIIFIFSGPPIIVEILRMVLDTVPEKYLEAQRKLDVVDEWILAICSLLIIVSIILTVQKNRRESAAKAGKRLIVIEGRGLRDDDGSPLDQAVTKDFEGKIIPILLDLRNRMDGKVIEPEQALNDIQVTQQSMLQHKNGDRSELKVVYGGLTSVPYTFLTGVLFDDEGNIVTYDWDRSQEAWRSLDDVDDGESFVVSGVEEITENEEAVIALAFSYPIENADLYNTFTHPVVKFTLNGMSSDAHWSQNKQNRLAQQFFEVVKKMSACGVKRIHLVMAAPNSVVFTFGRRYDKRNLPKLVVYQFERGEAAAYPWGILMPTSGVDRAQILYTEKASG